MLKLRYVDEVLSALKKTTSGRLALTVGGKDTPIGNQGLIRLLAGLEGNPYVQSLDLSRNLIGKPGAIHLARYLKNSPVKRLAVTGLSLFLLDARCQLLFTFSTRLVCLLESLCPWMQPIVSIVAATVSPTVFGSNCCHLLVTLLGFDLCRERD